MRSILKNTITSLAACLAMTGTFCFAQANTHAVSGVISDSAAGQVVLRDTVGRAVASPFSARAFTTLEWGELPGVPNDQYTVGAFVPFHVDPGTSLFFTELSGTVTDQGNGVFNGGFGWRYYMENRDRFVGIGTWFTNDGRGAEDFNAVGFHLESVGRWFNMRLNGSFLTDEDAQLVERSFLPDASFEGNNIVTTQLDQIEIPVNQLELMVEAPAPIFGKYGVNWGIGPYHYYNNSEDISTTGTKVNFHSQWTEDLWVDVDYQKDSFFGQKTMVSVTFMFPHRRSNRWFRQTPIRERLGNPVDRPRNIPFTSDLVQTSIALTSTKDGEAIQVVHIDPNATSNGDGTFENPYNNLPSFVNDPDIDIIRIVPRDDNTSSGLQIASGLDLYDCQWLVSSHIAHVLETVETTLFLPEQTDQTEGAWIQNVNNAPGGYVVSLANMNYVSGLQIDGEGVFGGNGNGIISQVPGITDFEIDRNSFFNHEYAIMLNEVDGVGLLTDNVIDGSNLDEDDLQVGPGIGGFTLTNTENLDLDLEASGNVITYHSETGYEVTASNGTIDHSFSNNTVQENGTGVSVTATDSAVINNIFDSNTISDNTGDSEDSAGLRVVATAGGQQFIENMFGNEIFDNAGNGVLFSAETGGTIYAESFYNNNLSSNGLNGFSAVSDGIGSEIEVYLGLQDAEGTLLPNVLDGNGAAGANFLASDLGVIVGRIENNEFTSNTGSGLLITAEDGGEANFGNGGAYAIFDNDFSDNGEYGIGLIANGDDNALINPSIIDADIFLNNIEDNGSHGIYAFGSGAGDNALIDLNIGGEDLENNIEGNGDTNIGIHLTENSTALVDILYNEITDATSGSLDSNFDGDGLGILLDGNSELLALNVLYNNFDGNSDNGINVISRTQSIHENDLIAFNVINGNGGDGINYERYGESIVKDVMIYGNTITDNTIGVDIFAQGGELDYRDSSTLYLTHYIGGPADGEGNIITGNSSHGVQASSAANALLWVDGDQNTVNENGGNGFDGSTNYFSSLFGIWDDSTFNDNGENGLELYEGDFVQAFQPIVMSFTDSTFNNNAEYGVDVTIASDTTFAASNPDLPTEINNNGSGGMRFIVPRSQRNPQVQVSAFISTVVQDVEIADNGGIGVEIDNTLDALSPTNPALDRTDVVGVFAGLFDTVDILRNDGDGVSSLTDDNDRTIIDFTDVKVIGNNGYGYNIINVDDDLTGDGEILTLGGYTSIDISGTNTAVPNNGNGSNSLVDNNNLGGIFVYNTTPDTFNRVDTNKSNPNTDIRVHQTAVRGNGSGATEPDEGDGLYILVGTSDIGVVNASITDSYFSGNANIDVVFASVAETADPGVAPYLNADGTLNDAYHADPLARLNLQFTGNKGSTFDAIRQGAYYDNDDPFKSPYIGSGDFFDNTSRRRNAQREAEDILLGSSSVIGGGGTLIENTLGDTVFTQTTTGSPVRSDNVDLSLLPAGYNGFLIDFISGAQANVDASPIPITSAAEISPAGRVQFGLASNFPTALTAGDEFNIIGSGATESSFSGLGLITDANRYVNNYIRFVGGGLNGEERRINSSGEDPLVAGATLFGTDPFSAAPNAADPFEVWALQVAGVGESTFKTEETAVNNNNDFSNVIKDFGDSFSLQPVGGDGNTNPYPFTWETGAGPFFGFPF